MKTFVVLGAILGLLLVAAPANAAFQLSLDDHAGNTALVTDNAAGDLDARPGVILVSATLGVWDLTITTGLSKPQIGSSLVPSMDVDPVVHSTGAGLLTVMISDTGFGPIAAGLSADLTEAAFTAAGNVDVYGWLDTTNAAFGTEYQKPSVLGLGPGADSGVAVAALPAAILAGANPFSMTLAVDITHTGAGLTTGDASNNFVPEPATLAIWSLLGVAGVMFSRRRRKVA